MTESSLMRGSERTRRRSETVTTTVSGSGAPGEADGLAIGVGAGMDGLADALPEADGDGVEVQPATRRTTSAIATG
jgi:hypothetical protein